MVKPLPYDHHCDRSYRDFSAIGNLGPSSRSFDSRVEFYNHNSFSNIYVHARLYLLERLDLEFVAGHSSAAITDSQRGDKDHSTFISNSSIGASPNANRPTPIRVLQRLHVLVRFHGKEEICHLGREFRYCGRLKKV